MSIGPDVRPGATTPRLPLLSSPGRAQVPLAADGDWIVLGDRPTSAITGSTYTYALWNISTGERRAGWDAPPDMQDWLGESSGGWLVTVRIGLSVPFADWRLILRNLRTGETREIAHSNPDVEKIPNLPVRLPSGFAPTPSVSGTRVTWSEFVLDPTGAVRKRIELYNLLDGSLSTLVEVVPSVEDVWGPSLAGNRVAWAHRPAAPNSQELVVLDLDNGGTTSFQVGGEIYGCALSADGENLAWDDRYVEKHVINVTNGERLQYAGDEGWGANRSGHYVSWQPLTGSYTAETASPGAGGFYDFEKGEVRFVAHEEDSTIISATLLGDWFVWQDRSPSADYFYFLRLSR